MTTIIYIGILIFIIYFITKKNQLIQQKTKATNTRKSNKPEKKMADELAYRIFKNIKPNVTSLSSTKNISDDSLIDITDQSYNINSNNYLKKYSNGVPYWPHQYVYSYSEIKSASIEQKKFYNTFKDNFLNDYFIDLEGNTNYAFILLFDLLNDYDSHRDLSKLENQLKILGRCYPKTKSYGISFLIEKMELDGYSDDISRLKAENNISRQNYEANYDYEYWRLGSKYKSKLNLNDEKVNLLNRIWYPSNNFCSIEFCLLEVLKLYIALFSELKKRYESEGTTLEKEFIFVADIVAIKHFRYRFGSQNYKYSIDSTTNEFYLNIFKHCENAVREFYGHKRKLNTDMYYVNEDAKFGFESKIISKVLELLPSLVLKVASPDEATELELNSQTTTRWKIKYEELTTNLYNNPKEFVVSIIKLGELNKKNPSIENIFFEASKFIAQYDRLASLTLYIYYVYYDLKSATFDHKQLTKTIQKKLFKTDEQFKDFEKIVQELINDKDLNKALNSLSDIYEVKRKKIQLDKTAIKEVQQQHSGTVELLNEYLRDEFDNESDSNQLHNQDDKEIKIEVIQKIEETGNSLFLSELSFNQIQISILNLFYKNNLSILQNEIGNFAKSNGFFKNQVIDSINEICFDVLDDNLIEEDDDYYTIIPQYFQTIIQNGK